MNNTSASFSLPVEQEVPAQISGIGGAAASDTEFHYCPPPLYDYDGDILENDNDNDNYSGNARVFRVGVQAIRSLESAYQEFNATFGDYLTLTVGRSIPHATFEMVPLEFPQLFSVTENNFDFIHVNPNAFSCIEAELGAESLVSQISARVVGGKEYHLTHFGGVIIALANNSEVQTIHDIQDKIVAATSLNGLGSGQMQFRQMCLAGLNHIRDPKQLVFTGNQDIVVQGVLRGEFDVGFVRTDQMERTVNDTSVLKVIDPQPNLTIVMDNNEPTPFPFLSSTPLYPEWNVAALPHVQPQVSLSVQTSLLSMSSYARTGRALQDCLDNSTIQDCIQAFLRLELDPQMRCDVTPEIALTAYRAMRQGNYAGWRTTLSYMKLRTIQETNGLLRYDADTHRWKCIRSDELYEAITCPEGYFKKSKEDIETGCQDAGLPCPPEYQCLCRPCRKGFDVDVFPIATDHPKDHHHDYLNHNDNDYDHDNYTPATTTITTTHGNYTLGCAKMSLCGTTEQFHPITFEAIDHLDRSNVNMTVVLHQGQDSETILATFVKDCTYQFTIQAQVLGVMTMEIFLGGEQIPESPLRILVEERNCAAEFDSVYLVANGKGDCVCKANYYMAVGGSTTCINLAVLLPCILLPLCILVGIISYLYVQHKRREADRIWMVDPSDLNYLRPPVVLGHGTFGVVVAATYHGTKVAVKKVLPPPSSRPIASHDTHAEESTPKAKNDKPNISADVEEGAEVPIAKSIKTSKTQEQRNSTDNHSYHHHYHRSSSSGLSKKMSPTFHAISGYQSGVLCVNNSSNGNSGAEFINLGQLSATSSSTRSRTQEILNICFGEPDMYQQLKEEFVQEMRLLSKLRHPCIVTVMGAVLSRDDEPLIVMEHMICGSLYDLIHNETVYINGEILLPIMRDIASGLRFLHSNPVIHGDIKAKNVLVATGFRAKVADFGLSVKKRNAKAFGTPYWMAPELLCAESRNTTQSDMYSIGMLLYELYSRKDPYLGLDTESVLKLVCDPLVNKRPLVPECCPPKIASTMKACWKANPHERPTAEDFDELLKPLLVEHVEPLYIGMRPSSRDSNSVQSVISSRFQQKRDLLYRVFPNRIADALIRGDKIEPESHECVTILFCDVVDLSQISRACSAVKVSNMLQRLNEALVTLAKKYDLFKVDTISDIFMACANLIKDQSEDHAKRVAEFSLEAVKLAAELPIDIDNPLTGCTKIRVGFHSGPVVSNVVGSVDPRYSLFGDSVNVALEMESKSKPDRILCSSAAAKLLKKQAPGIAITKRSNGNTFWINDGKAEFSL